MIDERMYKIKKMGPRKFGLDFHWNMVPSSTRYSENLQTFRDMINVVTLWCYENDMEPCVRFDAMNAIYPTGRNTISFRRHADAMAFQLRWT